jgi:SAM-dependent methyltransferase
LGYVFQSEDARNYSEWFLSEPGKSAMAIETGLLLRLWKPTSAQKVLEVGCGTGIFTEWFAGQGHQITGMEPSQHMLNIARLRLPNRIALDHGYAEDLPYDDNSFDTVAMITTLEFVEDPLQALREAFRVARRHVLLGVLNKYSLMAGQRFMERLWKKSVFDHARFFSVWQLHSLAAEALAPSAKIRWGTCLALPLAATRYVSFLERSPWVQWHPFGHFIAMRVNVEFTLQCIQDPVFTEPSRHLAHAPSNASCLSLESLTGGGNQEEGLLQGRP